jgi:hypothetical protein
MEAVIGTGSPDHSQIGVFEINIAVVYSSVVFFDDSWGVLGHHQGGGASFIWVRPLGQPAGQKY